MAGRSNKGTKRLLRLKGQTWWFVRDIPENCRHMFEGKTAYPVNLHTSDLKVAIERRDELEAETTKTFADIRAGRWTPGKGLSPEERGEVWRETLTPLFREAHEARAATKRQPVEIVSMTPEEAHKAGLYDDPVDLALRAAEAEEEALRGPGKRAFARALVGRVKVDHHVAAFMASQRLGEKTKKAREGLIGQFARWADENGITLDMVTRKVAGRYVSEKLDARHPTTATAHLLAIRQYWTYLHARGHVDGGPDGQKGGPWHGQLSKDNSRRVDQRTPKKERPFTDEEVTALLYSPYPARMRQDHRAQVVDVIKLCLLSGLRLEEAASLRVEDVSDGNIHVRQGKTASAIRAVPVHSELRGLIARRVKGKRPEDLLFHELKNEKAPSDVLGKRFARYRKNLGVHEKVESNRRSLVNFHSCRRWFITSARHAGQPKETIRELVGHEDGDDNGSDITFGVYTPGASEAQRRACVESVRLPSRPEHRRRKVAD